MDTLTILIPYRSSSVEMYDTIFVYTNPHFIRVGLGIKHENKAYIILFSDLDTKAKEGLIVRIHRFKINNHKDAIRTLISLNIISPNPIGENTSYLFYYHDHENFRQSSGGISKRIYF